MVGDKDFDSASIKARLLARQNELTALQATSKDERGPVELDQTRVGRLSRMDALQVQAMAVETERRRGVELRQIDSALQRLADGDYGYCVACDEPIAPKRLDFDPTTPLCIDCARGESPGS